MYSDTGDGAFVMRRLQKEGHRVKMYTHDKTAKDVYRGLVPLSYSPSPAKGDVVLFDMVKHGAKADAFRRSGFKVVGASKFADAIEINRPAGADVMRKIGIRVPETEVFKTLSAGQKFLEKQEGTWYYKPSGNLHCATTYNAEPKMLSRYLEWTKPHPPEQFELQKKMEGTEISLEGWFDGSRWVWPFNSTVEDKKLMAGDLGPRTGCMANIVWAYEDSRPTLALKTLTRLAPFLEAAGHVGPIDINIMLDKEGTPYGLEWTPRFGYDALQALCLLLQGDLGYQLARFASGQLEGFDVRTDAYALTINVSVPPYPNHEYAEREAKGLPVDPRLVTDAGVYPRDLMIQDGKPVVAGADGSVATIGAVGPDAALLRSEVREKASKYAIPMAQYRIDPVSRFENVLTALESFSYDMPAVRTIDTPERPMPRYEEPRGNPASRMVAGDNDKPRASAVLPSSPPVMQDSPTASI